ncbi:MAG: SMC-Scp complex subunit ScpB [bacterium]
MENDRKKNLLEALVFISSEPVSAKDLAKTTDFPEDEVTGLLKEIMDEYNARRGGILMVEVANGYQMVTNPDFAPFVRKLRKTAVASKLSQAALETLAIIAYKQPVTKPEVEDLRGVNSDGVIRSLAEKRLIKILGQKEVPGRPFLYGTSKEFLQFFGLKDLSELPTLKELKRDDAL